MNRRFSALVLVGLLAVGAGLTYSLMTSDQQTSAGPAPIELLLKERYPDATGHITDLNSYRGQVLVLNFWASWCAPCVEEMPELSQLQTELTDKGVQFLGLGIDNAANVLAFSREVKVLYPLLVAGASGIELGRQFGNHQGALPFTVVVDHAGEIADRSLGRVDIERLRRVILRIVKEHQSR